MAGAHTSHYLPMIRAVSSSINDSHSFIVFSSSRWSDAWFVACQGKRKESCLERRTVSFTFNPVSTVCFVLFILLCAEGAIAIVPSGFSSNETSWMTRATRHRTREAKGELAFGAVLPSWKAHVCSWVAFLSPWLWDTDVALMMIVDAIALFYRSVPQRQMISRSFAQ